MLDGTLAQLVEHRAFNPLVEGSSPSRPTGETREKMTYQDLKDKLSVLTPEQLAMTVTVSNGWRWNEIADFCDGEHFVDERTLPVLMFQEEKK